MAYKFVTLEDLSNMIKSETEVHEGHIQTLEALQQAIIAGDTVFHEQETDKWYIVKKGESIPLHLQNEILGK